MADDDILTITAYDDGTHKVTIGDASWLVPATVSLDEIRAELGRTYALGESRLMVRGTIH